ncbi:MAG: hypothetical protein K6B74_13720 [Ruminococcus sp.]|nr:hypothetical protein [Ruminococcus sp.]
MNKEKLFKPLSILNFIMFLLCLITQSQALIAGTALLTGIRVVIRYSSAAIKDRYYNDKE